MLPFKRAGLHERIVQATVFPLTALLGLAVLVPFIMMLALSFGDIDDWWNGRKWPDLRHLHSARRMYVHYLATRYDYWPSMTGFNELYGVEADDTVTILGLEAVPPLAGDWRARGRLGLEAVSTLPWSHVHPLFTGWFFYRGGSGHDLAAFTGLSDEAWKDWLKRRFHSIAAVNAKFATGFLAFPYVKVPDLPEMTDRPGWVAGDSWAAEYTRFLEAGLPSAWRLPILGDVVWRNWLQAQPGTADLAKVNATFGTGWQGWREVRLAETVPPGREGAVWESYVRKALSPYFIELVVTPPLEDAWRRFLLARHGSVEGVDRVYGSAGAHIPLAVLAQNCESATAFADWDAFVRTVPATFLRLATAERAWRRALHAKFGTTAEAAAAFGIPVGSLDTVAWPQAEMDRLDWEQHRMRFTLELVFKNYRRVWSLMTDASDAILNTARFALLFTLLAVAVNGSAAYVLSRFALGPLQMSLVLFLALAAFPIEAMAVPNFILLRATGLLNTVWALVLPTAVNGYYVYLLKSFFDSIPKSYFEEATLEGAGEWHLFWTVSVPLARPMLAVVGLYAFLWSYSNFMWALIVGQSRDQWTLPVLIF